MVGKMRRKFDMMRNNDEMRSESGQVRDKCNKNKRKPR